MSTRGSLRALIAICFALALGAAEGGEAPGATAAASQTYHNALLRHVTLQVPPAGGRTTVEGAIAQICRAVEVPYQSAHSRGLAGKKVAVSLAPFRLNNVVAATAIRSICARAGLEPQLDGNGVYLSPKAEEQEQPQAAPRRLTRLQRVQLGAALNVSARPHINKDIEKHKTTRAWDDEGSELEIHTKETRQSVQVEVWVQATRRLDGLKAVVRLYGLEYVLTPEKPSDDHPPSFKEKHTLTELGSQEIPIGTVNHGQRGVLRSKVTTIAYTDTKYRLILRVDGDEDRRWSDEYRSGTRYYAWLVDICVGDQVIKSITSTKGLFRTLGRDPSTGLPR